MFWMIARVTGIGVMGLSGAMLLVLLAGRLMTPFAVAFNQFDTVNGVYYVHLVDPVHLLSHDLSFGKVENATETIPPEVTKVRAAPRAGSVELFVEWADGRQQQITFPDSFGNHVTEQRYNAVPVWSPDGDRIAFISAYGQGHMDIYVIRPDGSDLRLVAHDVESVTGLRLRWVSLAG